MPTYTVVLQNTAVDGRRAAVIVPAGATAPAAHTSVGTFNHDGSHVSDVFYHHVRDLLYMAGVRDMMNVDIKMDDQVFSTGFTLSKSTIALVGTANTTALIQTEPDWATEVSGYTAVSSDPAKATVSRAGKTLTVTGVVAGTSTITVTNGLSGGDLVSRTIVVTVT